MAGNDDQNNDDGKNDDGKPDTGTDDGKPDGDNDDTDGDDSADKWKALARKHEKAARKAQDALDKQTDATASEQEKAIKKAADEARDEARAEALADRIDDALESVAGAKLAKAGHVRLLDVADRVAAFSTADGKLDRPAIERAIDKLVKDNPELGKDGSEAKPLKGGGKNGSASGKFSMNDAIREAAGR